jgi:nucleotide-binding universal stress UspA family protein
MDPRPVVVAFDGSEAAQAALREASELFTGRPILIVSVWEPGIALIPQSADPVMVAYTPSFEQVQAVDRAQEERASAVAEAGVQIAREAGATAQAIAISDDSDVAGTVCEVANDNDAAAIVVGSRGHGRVASHLFGSTTQRLLRDTRRPVLVVRAPDSDKSGRR